MTTLIRSFATFGVTALAIHCPASEPQAQLCPESTVWSGCWDAVGFPVQALTFAWTEDGYPVEWSAAEPCLMGACFDLPSGVLEAAASGQPYYPCINSMHAVETYRLEGLPSGSAVDLRVRMRVTGSVTGPADGYASIITASHTGGFLASEGDSAIDEWIEVTLHVTGADEFQVLYQLHAGGGWPYGSAYLRGEFHFTDLPPGVRVVACRGYDAEVQALATTWGRVKNLYR